tara:strand:- start:20 stop:1420 length:1401 start_codon:yes stop_codon:yes gene_type:complete
MGAAAGPNTIEDGLVLALDAGNSKSWNVGVSTNWTDMIGSNDGTLTNGPLHSQGPFPGAGSVFFDGQGNHTELDVIHTSSLSADFDLSGNISSTVECWVYLNSYPLTTTGGSTPHYSGATIFSIKNTSNQLGKYYRFSISDSGQLTLRADYANGFPNTGHSTSTLSLNTWYHIAWVRDSGSNRFFLNGTEITSEFSTPNASDMIRSGNSKISIGADYYASSYLNWIRPITGYISNFRVVNGAALYTSNFTVPTKPLTDVPNTVLLTCQGSSITDASSSAHTLSSNGGPTATYNVAPYFDFDGTNDYVDVSGSITVSAATFLAWIRLDDLSQTSYTGIVFSRNPSGSISGMNFYAATENIGYHWNDASNTYSWNSGLTIPNQEWCMVALTVSSSVATAYLFRSSGMTSATNSVSHGSTTLDAIKVGADVPTNRYLDGRIGVAMIYNKALTAAELQRNYNALKGRYGY